MFVVNTNFANAKRIHFLGKAAEIVTELHVGMRVGRGRKWNPLLHRQLKDSVAWIKFVDRLTPASSGKFNPKVARTNEIERFADDCVNLRIWPMTMDFDEVEMSKAVDEPNRRYFADAAKVIIVNGINIAPFELLSAHRDAVEHLIVAIKKVDGAQDKIELIPMLLDPFSPGFRVDWIIVQLDAGANFQIDIFVTQTVDFIKIDSGVIPIVIGESNVA